VDPAQVGTACCTLQPAAFQELAAELAALMALAALPGGINGSGGMIWRQSWRQ